MYFALKRHGTVTHGFNVTARFVDCVGCGLNCAAFVEAREKVLKQNFFDQQVSVIDSVCPPKGTIDAKSSCQRSAVLPLAMKTAAVQLGRFPTIYSVANNDLYCGLGGQVWQCQASPEARDRAQPRSQNASMSPPMRRGSPALILMGT